MSPKEVVLNQLVMCHSLYESAVKDLSEADMRHQPFAGASHVNWILAHLAVSEDSMIAQLLGKENRLSPELHKNYSGGSVCRADDGLTKAEAWKLFTEQGKLTAEFIKTFPESRYDEASPEKLRGFVPTIGGVVGLLSTHPYWHFGQVTFNRRAMKKAPLFGG